MQKYSQYWEKLDLVSINKKEKPVYTFRCLICSHVYTNQNNAASHVAKCLKDHKKQQNQTHLQSFGFGGEPPQPREEEPPPKQVVETAHPISDLDISLIELIADANIPYTAVNSTPWVEFLYKMNPQYHIPSNHKLRQMIIDHSQTTLDKGLKELKNSVCGLAVDGATLIHKHCYAFILIFQAGLRLARIKELTKQDAASLSSAIAEVIRTCQHYNITISGVVSDNAPALVKALVDNDPKSQCTLLAQLGSEILRCACSAHTGQLAIVDLLKSDLLNVFYNNVIGLIQWIKERKPSFGLVCPYKVPSFISTRWNTLYLCAEFIWNNKDAIDAFIKDQSQLEHDQYMAAVAQFNSRKQQTPPKKPSVPPVEQVPTDWKLYLDPLKIILEFTDQVEKDLSFQQEVYVAVITAIQKLQALRTPIGDSLSFFFDKRFRETADISLSKLAYYLTPNGVNAFREMPVAERKALFSELKKTFLKVSEKLPIERTLYFPAIFRYFFDNVEVNQGDSPFYVFEELENQSFSIPGINSGRPVSFSFFAAFCRALLTLPASEAMVERCFSQVKSIATDFNKTMKSDLFIALSTLKLTVRYKRKYFFTKNDDLEEEEDN